MPLRTATLGQVRSRNSAPKEPLAPLEKWKGTRSSSPGSSVPLGLSQWKGRRSGPPRRPSRGAAPSARRCSTRAHRKKTTQSPAFRSDTVPEAVPSPLVTRTRRSGSGPATSVGSSKVFSLGGAALSSSCCSRADRLCSSAFSLLSSSGVLRSSAWLCCSRAPRRRSSSSSRSLASKYAAELFRAHAKSGSDATRSSSTAASSTRCGATRSIPPCSLFFARSRDVSRPPRRRRALRPGRRIVASAGCFVRIGQ